MIFQDGFACRRLDITAESLNGAVEMAGNVIIGLPQGQFPEFEQEPQSKTGNKSFARF